MSKEKITLLFHGFQTFKKPHEHDFDAFIKFAEGKTDSEIEKVYWYDSSKKETLGKKNYENTIRNAIKKHEGKEITLIGYSAGTVVSLGFCSEFKEIKKVILIYPTVYVFITRWFLFTMLSGWWNTKRKWSKKHNKAPGKAKNRLEKYLDKNNIEEKYLYHLAFSLAYSRKQWRKKIKNIHNKDITMIWNYKDEVNNVEKSQKYLEKHLEKETNKVSLLEATLPHGEILHKENEDIFKILIDLINK